MSVTIIRLNICNFEVPKDAHPTGQELAKKMEVHYSMIWRVKNGPERGPRFYCWSVKVPRIKILNLIWVDLAICANQKEVSMIPEPYARPVMSKNKAAQLLGIDRKTLAKTKFY